MRIQVDFGIGDVMVPGPRMIEFPVLLAGDPLRLLAYPIESSIAEKLQAMVALGSANSRMKDFYDVWICSRHLDFNGGALGKAIEATFRNRETSIPGGEADAFKEAFVVAHAVQWNAFVKRIGERDLVDAFGAVVDDLKTFAVPLFSRLARGERLAQRWKAGQGWVSG